MSYIIEFKTSEKVMHNGADICFLMRQDFIEMFGGSIVSKGGLDDATKLCEIILAYYYLLTGYKININYEFIDYEFLPFDIEE
jgi:hypothetical protein